MKLYDIIHKIKNVLMKDSNIPTKIKTIHKIQSTIKLIAINGINLNHRKDFFSFVVAVF